MSQLNINWYLRINDKQATRVFIKLVLRFT